LNTADVIIHLNKALLHRNSSQKVVLHFAHAVDDASRSGKAVAACEAFSAHANMTMPLPKRCLKPPRQAAQYARSRA